MNVKLEIISKCCKRGWSGPGSNNNMRFETGATESASIFSEMHSVCCEGAAGLSACSDQTRSAAAGLGLS